MLATEPVCSARRRGIAEVTHPLGPDPELPLAKQEILSAPAVQGFNRRVRTEVFHVVFPQSDTIRAGLGPGRLKECGIRNTLAELLHVGTGDGDAGTVYRGIRQGICGALIAGGLQIGATEHENICLTRGSDTNLVDTEIEERQPVIDRCHETVDGLDRRGMTDRDVLLDLLVGIARSDSALLRRPAREALAARRFVMRR